MLKLAVTVAPLDSYPQALVVFRGLEESLPEAAALGYDGVEIAVYRRENVDAPRLRRLLTDCGLAVPVFSTGQMFTMLQVWFTHPDREVRDRAVGVFEGVIDLCAEFGASANISRVRGYIHDGDSYETGLGRLSDCLGRLSRRAEPAGVTLLLEQMNMFETNYLHSVPEVGEYIRSLGLPNLRIHADTFHMNIHDVDMCRNLREYAPLLGYIHLSDSNRLSPGRGHIDFPAVLATLRESGYGGWAGIEVLTQPSPREAARLAIEYLRSLV